MTIDPALLALVERDADAIEHAMYEGRLADLGLRTDAEVRAQIEISLGEAGIGRHAMAALAAADYWQDPGAFAPRRWAALWRSCQVNAVEDLYWTLQGPDPTLAALRCAVPGCLSGGPFELLGSLPVCVPHRVELHQAQAPTTFGGDL